MRQNLLCLLCSVVLTSAAQAQDHRALGPRSFLPPDYVGEAYVNFEALLETDVWDEIERSALAKLGFAAFKHEFGFRLDDLTELRGTMVFRQQRGDPDMPAYRADSVTIFEGPGPFTLPEPRDGHGEYDRRTAERIGDVDVVREGPEESNGYWRPKLFVVPKPGLLVFGDRDLIEPVLRGERRGGVPHPELMAVTATQRPMAYIAIKVNYDDEYMRQALPFPADWYTERDKPTFWTARLVVDEDTGRTSVVARMRFTNGEAGPQLMTKSVREAFAKIDTDPQLKNMKFLKKLGKQITFEQEDTDWVATLDLGDRGKMIGDLAVANALPMLIFSARRAVEEQVIVMEEARALAEEEPEEEKAESGKKNKKKRAP